MRRRIVLGLVAAAALAGLTAGVAVTKDDPDARATGPPAASTSTTAPPGRASPGASDVGDPYFPGLGNGGYDVTHYALDLTWTPEDARLDGVATIRAIATQWLSRFDLDLVGLDVAGVTVDGVAAEVAREGARELVITPSTTIARGVDFRVEVTYGGRPAAQPSIDGVEPGWTSDDEGEVHVIGEPAGAATFFPVNDHPTDKATYELRVTVPEGMAVAANGTLSDRRALGGTEQWTYRAEDPMASYLVQVVIANLAFDRDVGPDDLPLRYAYDHDVAEVARRAMTRTPEAIAAFEEMFGPYPFESYGTVVVDEALSLALESQTLSLFGADALRESVVVHELAHQWFGDDVSPATWRDIWLNEGFATYAEWLWSEASGGPSADALARRAEAAARDLDVAPADPGPDDLFAETVYVRGALTLHVLRHELGDDGFFELLRTWLARYGGRTASTADFEALATDAAGEDLSALFSAWLHRADAPDLSDWEG
ncbi:MAG TPA: M1 family metallopeptidase [Acidimicrobiales bacterium]|nr:M1 family metallopeptidase [Acidimicrobiales bacterium]